MCTISAASCFPEPFINDGRRLGFIHRNFSGTRFSDHVALLAVFQAWDDVRSALSSGSDGEKVVLGSAQTLHSVCLFRINGEDAETAFCEHKRLNMSTLRMTWEAKVQLKEILVNSGFPEGT